MLKVVQLPPETDLLPDGSKPGGWYRELPDGRLLCELCPRACKLHEGDRGFCFVRQNIGGQIVLTTYGRSTGFCIDPIEKKPLNHFYPGTSVLSFGTAGCNLGCKFCQNWDISKSREIERLSETAMPDAVVAAAKRHHCRSVAFTYNDPVIWAEYAIDTAKLCRAEGIKTVAVTAGYITADARGPFYQYMDAANVDLKGFTESFYQHYTLSHLQPVLDTLEWLHKETDVWLEITNLVIPQANDSADEIRQMCQWILEHLDDKVPVHFTAFHPDFRLRDRPPTPPETLWMAHEIATQMGLKYVYVGNINDWKHQSTYCHNCGKLVIARNWYDLGAYHLVGNRCEYCHAEIPGRFDRAPGNWGRRRMPVRIADFRVPPIVNLTATDKTKNTTTHRGEHTAPQPNCRPNGGAACRESSRQVGTQLPDANSIDASLHDPPSAGSTRTSLGKFAGKVSLSPNNTDYAGPLSVAACHAAGPHSTSVHERPSSASSAATENSSAGFHSRTGRNTEGKTDLPARRTAMGDTESTLTFTRHQEATILSAACEVIAAEIAGRQVAWRDPTLAAAAGYIVDGVFVTLKRRGRLRACCGALGNGLRLDVGLRQAAVRTATQDVRLPLIGMSELPFLSVDVTFLYGFRLLPIDAEARKAAVVIGRHGLQIRTAETGGLLLPQVAVEHGWDAEEFLEHVAMKAGLPRHAWQDPHAELSTFEGYRISGDFDPTAAQFFAQLAPYGFDGATLQQMAETVRQNIWARWTGATPSYYLPGVPDRTVHGVAVTLQGADHQQTWQVQLSTRPGLPLQSTLYHLSVVLAESLAGSQGYSWQTPVKAEVAVLEDLHMHGTLADPDLRGFDPERRLLLIGTGGHRVGIFDPTEKPERLVDAVAEEAQVLDPETAGLWSFLTSTTASRIRIAATATGGTSSRGDAPRVRPAAVAGSFYPADPQRLQRLMDQLLEVSPPPRSFWPAALVPHAGLIYSGRIAAQVWQRLEIPDTVIILCPKHTRWGANFAVAPHGQWQIPGQTISGNVELARRLADAVPQWQLDEKAHQHEHAIEIELPFVARLAAHARVVGVAIGPCDYEDACRFADGLVRVLRDCHPRPVLVISSDMNHYAHDEENRRRDALALQAMASLDPRRLYDTVRHHDISMCGVMPAVIVMETLRRWDGLHRFEQVAYGTSGDVSGDRSRVVGYAGVLFA